MQEEILFLYLNDDIKKRIDESDKYYSKDLLYKNIFRKKILNIALINFLEFLKQIEIDINFIDEIKSKIENNINKI